MSFDKNNTKLAYDGWSSPREFITQLRDWMSVVGMRMDNEQRLLAIFKQSLKANGRARGWFELKQASMTPLATLQQAEDALVAKFYTTEMKTAEMNEVMDPSFVQDENESIDEFAVRFTEARVKCERASTALGMGARSETDYGFLFRQKVLPYLQAELQRFNVELDKSVEELTDRLRGFERAVLTSNQVQSVSQMRKFSVKRHAEESVDGQHRDKIQRHETVHQVNMMSSPGVHNPEMAQLQARVAEQEAELSRVRREEDARRLAQEEKLRSQSEQARQQANNRALVAQVTEVVRDELRGNQQLQNRDGGTHPDIRCYSCQGHGHFARDCPRGQQNVPRCFKCAERGHKTYECPQGRGGRSAGGQGRMQRCASCGTAGHHERDCFRGRDSASVRERCSGCDSVHAAYNCPARDNRCDRCGGFGHFSRCCRTRMGAPQDRGQRGGRGRQHAPRDRGQGPRGNGSAGDSMIQAVNQLVQSNTQLVAALNPQSAPGNGR